MVSTLLIAIAVAFVASLLLSAIALKLFPWFRSGERKEGHFRPDQSTGSFRVVMDKGGEQVKKIRVSSRELPLVGGPAMVIAIMVAAIGTGVFIGLTSDQWLLLAILLIGMVGFAAVGFVDDWRKVHVGEGISEIQKFAGVVVVSLAAAIALNRLIITRYLSARLAYPPYSDVPVLGQILVHTHFAWIVFFLLMTVTVASATSLAVDFSDGMDGLSGGLMFSAALAFAAILLGENRPDLWPAALVVLAIAGASAGYLPFNWPSSWRARTPGQRRRRAVLIMGDSGSLALGGVLALVAVISRLEFVLIFIGGVFVLEGVSALISARILVRFYRHFLVLERYGAGKGFVHTEFPLPFLATPMHHHYDLLGWDRQRLVYGAWLLGAVLGALGVASVIGTFTWERYLARFVALVIILAVWQSGPWTRSYFIGLARARGADPEAPRRLALFYGFPYRLFGRPLFSQVDITGADEDTLRTPAERLSLWQRMSVFDARAALGFYCYRSGQSDDALRLWDAIPKANLKQRPEIKEMLEEVRHAAASEASDQLPDLLRQPFAPADGATTLPGLKAQPAENAESHDDLSASQWRMPSPGATGGTKLTSAHLEPVNSSAPMLDEAHPDVEQFWKAERYTQWLEHSPTEPALPSAALTYPPSEERTATAAQQQVQPAAGDATPVPEVSGSRHESPGSTS